MDDARRVARALVEARLAACVQLDTIEASFYRWEGKLCEEAEVRLTIKTSPAKVEEIGAFFDEHHPYDVPQFIAAPCTASQAYAAWVAGELA